jgi:phytanoyl-CoA hydroxylase
MTTPLGDFEGHVDQVDDRSLTGWAWTHTEPNQPIDVELLIDGIVVSRYTAAGYRPDLEEAGKGNGRHGFQVPLPRVADGVSHELRVVFGGTRLDLHGSPRRCTFGSSTETTTEMPALPRVGARYRSRFGGLWTDLSNAKEVAEGKCALGWLSSAEAKLLADWIDQGFVVLPQAVPHDLIDRLDTDVDRVWAGTSRERAVVEYWEEGKLTIQKASPRFREERVKLLDLYGHLDTARQIVFSPAILRFLTLLFERPVVAFQSLYFRWGSQQDIHQDTAFVKVSSPMEFAASWIALEDIRPGSGELEYYVGSHQLDDYLFDQDQKWMPLPFDNAVYEGFIASLGRRSRERGLQRVRFLPKKGDVLIWSADLAHGGSKNPSPGVTRKSLVTHYCPANCEPIYGGGPTPRHKYTESAYYTLARRDSR